ncbi:hypothetical protein ACTFIY_012681 [Dictyostelium cf. discoideum]
MSTTIDNLNGGVEVEVEVGVEEEEEEEEEISLYCKSFNWKELRRENRDNVHMWCDVHDGEEHTFEELASFYAVCIRDQFVHMKFNFRDLKLHKVSFVAKSKYDLYNSLIPKNHGNNIQQSFLFHSNSMENPNYEENIIKFSRESIDLVRYYFEVYYGNSKYLKNWSIFGNSDEYYCKIIKFK